MGLHLEHFMAAGQDIEKAHYHILGEIQQVQEAFSRNIIYPHLGELIKLHGTLTTVLEGLADLHDALPGTMTKIDLEAQEVRYEKPTLGHMDVVEDLIRWALPHLQRTIEEGRTIYEFVERHLFLEEVGIRPGYIEEGYLIMPDPQAHQLHVLRYTISVFTHAEERYRSLRTAYVKSMPQRGIYPSPRSIKLALLDEQPDLPNPATYFFATDLDFPFEQTMLPVAKRKLMRYLFSHGGLA